MKIPCRLWALDVADWPSAGMSPRTGQHRVATARRMMVAPISKKAITQAPLRAWSPARVTASVLRKMRTAAPPVNSGLHTGLLLAQNPYNRLFRKPTRLHVHPFPIDGLYPFSEEIVGLRSVANGFPTRPVELRLDRSPHRDGRARARRQPARDNAHGERDRAPVEPPADNPRRWTDSVENRA
jgi:hypothetical protein